ncbi:MAG TPA: cardiolipin synthase ClsB [Methylibium sp.]|uniref:cardiolipin synthase ClsB n=1 Tax=Methylibium sp. TaxID=2067992 RepID=UPI002DBCEA62|nr:cardiolipin synthase ClsB [Methylibium sp.]HEU4458342.1 cardiolipin synthase ClsB [Methylibium sp.]
MSSRWRDGNRFELLENGEAFFPAVFAAIGQAREEVLIETFILFEDKVGLELHAVLIAAARRGVKVHLTVDGWGSHDLSAGFVHALTEAGVAFHVFDPIWRVLGRSLNSLRRMHRKIVVIDGRLAFVGGINYSADHLGDYGPQAKQDYAVECRGPIVGDIHRFVRAVLRLPDEAGAPPQRRWRRRADAPEAALPPAGEAKALFVTRDNHRHRTDIERHYRAAIRAARREITIANAYFFPGWRLLRELRAAARRGVRVNLILQGEPDMPIVKFGARSLYEHLLRAGVRIHEYCERPLHGKVAWIDDQWATFGSSNLDPLSLSLNLEANVVVRDAAFVANLRERLDRLMRDSCKEIRADPKRKASFVKMLLGVVAFHLVRRFPAWALRLPAHKPTIASMPEGVVREPGEPPPPEPTPALRNGAERAATTEHAA